MRQWYCDLGALLCIMVSELGASVGAGAGTAKLIMSLKAASNYMATFDTDATVASVYKAAASHAVNVKSYIEKRDSQGIANYIKDNANNVSSLAHMASAISQLRGKSAELCWVRFSELNGKLIQEPHT